MRSADGSWSPRRVRRGCGVHGSSEAWAEAARNCARLLQQDDRLGRGVPNDAVLAGEAEAEVIATRGERWRSKRGGVFPGWSRLVEEAEHAAARHVEQVERGLARFRKP